MWLTGWQYRKKITISGSTGAGTNYQVLLKVGESSGATGADFHLEEHSANFPSGRNQGGDLRFTASDETTLLNFWVESVSGTSPNRVAKIWVKVSEDLGTNKDIYIYYNNPSATNYSNGDNTFLLFDDFEGSSLDTNKWTSSVSGDGSLSVSSSNVDITADTTLAAGNAEFTSILSFSYPICMEFYGGGGTYYKYGDFRIGLISGDNYILATTSNNGGSVDNYFKTSLSGTETSTYLGLDDNYFYTAKYKIERLNGSAKLYRDGSLLVTHTTNVPTANLNVDSRVSDWNTGSYMSGPGAGYDYIFIRKLNSPEPAFSTAGGEELPNIVYVSFSFSSSYVSKLKSYFDFTFSLIPFLAYKIKKILQISFNLISSFAAYRSKILKGIARKILNPKGRGSIRNR